MKLILLQYLIILLCSSCAERDNKNEFLYQICNEYKFSDVFISIPVQDSTQTLSVCLTNTNLYEYVYQRYYSKSYDNFYKFLINIIEKKLQIKIKQLKILPYCVTNKSLIENEYNEFGLTLIIKKYLKIRDEQLILDNLGTNDYCTIIKIMFENSFFIVKDDYRGEFHFYKYPYNNK